MSRDTYDHAPAPLYECLARIEGESNFLSLLAGIEAGPDTTEPMGALAFTRAAGAIPEVLEAHVARSRLFQRPIMSMVFCAIVHELKAERKEWPWILGAVADAFIELRDGSRFVKPVKDRARHFCVDASVYGVMRKVAGRILDDLLSFARAKFYRAMRSIPSSPGFRHYQGTPSTFSDRAAMGHYIQRPLASSAEIGPGHTAVIDTHGIGMADRLGYDDRQDSPGPVLTLYGDEAEEHCRKYPAHSNRPHSL